MNLYLALLLLTTPTTPAIGFNAPEPPPIMLIIDEPIKRGDPVSAARAVPLSKVLKNPAAYAGRSIVVEGRIGGVCPVKGCWMEIAPKKGGKGVRVTFKNYGFFVPIDSEGMNIRAEGEVVVNTLSKEDVDHMVGEGAKIKRNADGTATEVTFVASGVELRK